MRLCSKFVLGVAFSVCLTSGSARSQIPADDTPTPPPITKGYDYAPNAANQMASPAEDAPTAPPLGVSPADSPVAESRSASKFSASTILAVLLVLGVAIFVIFTQVLQKRNGTSAAIAKPVSRLPSAPPGPPASSKSVFISYRRLDSADITGRIYDRLAQHFGKTSIFKDVDSIPLGIDFRKHLQNSVGQCSVLLIIIGKNWLTPAENGSPRINDVKDHLRIELETALQRDIPIIPVLVQGATVPEESALPSSLGSLAYRNGIEVRPDPDFHGDMDRLIRGVEAHLT